MLTKRWKTTIEEKHKILIIFDETLSDMNSNKKLYSAVAELFIRGRKLKMLVVFITQSNF